MPSVNQGEAYNYCLYRPSIPAGDIIFYGAVQSHQTAGKTAILIISKSVLYRGGGGATTKSAEKKRKTGGKIEEGKEGVHENCAQGRNLVSRHGKRKRERKAPYLLMNRNRVAMEGHVGRGSRRANPKYVMAVATSEVVENFSYDVSHGLLEVNEYEVPA